MVLTTHAVIGAALGALTANPAEAVAVGAISHYLLDAIPHWEYSLNALAERPANPLDKQFKFGAGSAWDFTRLAIDAGLALVLVWTLGALFGFSSSAFWWGALGGVLPDGLQFFYYRYHWRWLAPLQRLHLFMHADADLKSQPWLGVPAQICLAALVIWCSILLV
jgi:hypothetical protein